MSTISAATSADHLAFARLVFEMNATQLISLVKVDLHVDDTRDGNAHLPVAILGHTVVAFPVYNALMKLVRVILIVLLLACCSLWVASFWGISFLFPGNQLKIELFSGHIGIEYFYIDLKMKPTFSVSGFRGVHTTWWPMVRRVNTSSNWSYAVVLWLPTLLLALPVAISESSWARRRRRAKVGLCFQCGYDLRGAEHEACPECGRRVRKTRPA